jgi:hypothetical protein
MKNRIKKQVIIILTVVLNITGFPKSKFGKFRNDEHFQFFYDVLGLILRIGALLLGIPKEFEAFAKSFDDEDTALKKIQKSAHTDELLRLDSFRDASYRGLVEAGLAMLKHRDPDIVKSAKNTKILFDTYGNLAKKPFREQTSGVINLLQEARGKYAADFQKLGLTPWVAQLEIDNNAYIALDIERMDETADRTPLKLSDCRLATERAYVALIDRLNVLAIVENEKGAAADMTAYTEFAAKHSAFVDKYSHILAQREGIAKAKKAAQTITE